MKILFDFLPIILFFSMFKYAENHKEWAAAFATDHLGGIVSGGIVGPGEAPVLLATVVVIAATLAQVTWLMLRRRKVDTMLWVNLGLVALLGGATIWFHNEAFIKWKLSVLYWIAGLAFWLSPLLFNKNLVRAMMGEQLNLPASAWRRLNLAWVAFFSVMGLLNIFVAYSFSTDTWVNFKLFGGMGLLLLFALAQGLYMSRFMSESNLPEKSADKPL